MTANEVFTFLVPFLIKNAAFIVFYFIIGFGPGFIAGMLLANRFFGEGPTLFETHMENIKKAGQHNSQWNPTNDRWKS